MSWGMRVFWLLALVFTAYAAICIYVFFMQRRMMYFPSHASENEMQAEAKRCGLVRWRDGHGMPIGWMTDDGTPGPPVMILHGNAGHATNRAGLVARLRQAGIAARFFILDYPGYGSRPGTPTQATLTRAATDALDSLPGPAVLVGESLGTGVAAGVAAVRPDRVRGLILITPFDSMVRAAASHYPWLPVGLLLLDRYDSAAALREFPGPVAIIVAGRDRTTPPEGGRRLAECLQGPKFLLIVPEADHNDAASAVSDRDWRAAWNFVAMPPGS